MNNCIIIEGLDGVGKTTLAKLIVQQLGGIYYKTPPEPFIERCKQMDKHGVTFTEERFNLFVESVTFASKEVEKLIEDNKIVIVDRWIWTTLAYHLAGNPKLYEKWKDNWQDITSDLLEPALSV